MLLSRGAQRIPSSPALRKSVTLHKELELEKSMHMRAQCRRQKRVVLFVFLFLTAASNVLFYCEGFCWDGDPNAKDSPERKTTRFMGESNAAKIVKGEAQPKALQRRVENGTKGTEKIPSRVTSQRAAQETWQASPSPLGTW